MPARPLLPVFAATLLVASFASFAATPAWLGGGTIKGNGVMKSQVRDVKGFNGVALGLPAQVEVRQGATEGVTLETDENLLPFIETKVQGGVLRIRATERNTTLQTRTLKIVVHGRQVDQLSVGGSGSIAAPTVRSNRLSLEIGGTGSIDVGRAECEQVSAAIGGSGSVKLGGAGRALSVSIGGSGEVEASRFKAREVSVSIGGSGDVAVSASDTLSVSLAGSGDVKYYGDPKVQTSAVGSARVKRAGPALP